MAKEKVHGSFREMHNSIHNIAAPAAPERVAMKVAGNPNVLEEAREPTANASYRKGGAVTPRAYHSDHHNYKVKGHR